MADEPPKRRRGRPPEGDHAMTAAERQRRARFRRKNSPKRDNILVAIAQVQALNWTITRIEEIASETEDPVRRKRLEGHCATLRSVWKKVVATLRKADRLDP